MGVNQIYREYEIRSIREFNMPLEENDELQAEAYAKGEALKEGFDFTFKMEKAPPKAEEPRKGPPKELDWSKTEVEFHQE